VVRTVILVVHVAAGVTGLALGLGALPAAVAGRRGSPATVGYQAAVTVLTLTAAALVVMRPALWPFALIAAGTEGAVVGAWWAARRRFEGWLPWHVRLLCGSYVSLVTALLVVSWGGVVAWVLPSVVGAALVERAAARADRPRGEPVPT
jgi:hypothetical protein